MSNSGQNVFKGMNTQAIASLLLFLKGINEADFGSIHLEDPKWEDFTLRYKTGKKIIGESKDWKSPLTWGTVKSEILEKISNRPLTVNENDEILIVCQEVNDDVESAARNLKYGFEELYEKAREHDYSDELIDLLSKTDFFIIKPTEDTNPKDYLYSEAYAYFQKQVDYWLPEYELNNFVRTVLVDEIYLKSEKGGVFTKEELRERIKDYKRKKIKGSYAYDTEREDIQKHEVYQKLKTVIDDPSQGEQILNEQNFTAITAQPQLGYLVLDLLSELKENEILDFAEIWNRLLSSPYAYRVLYILEKYIDTTEVAQYILEITVRLFPEFRYRLREKELQENVAKLTHDILEKHPSLENEVYQVINTILVHRAQAYRKFDDRYSFERERLHVARTINKLFELTEGQERQENIIEIIAQKFDLISDHGKHSLFTPPPVFNTLCSHIEKDFEENFEKVKQIFINQLSNKWEGVEYKGWDHSGSGISQMGKSFSIHDHHYVSMTLSPSLKKFYEKDKQEVWEFVTENCLARDPENVSRGNPDFLNRAAIPILLDEYTNGENADEAYEILVDFIKMRKGIPWKNDIIFQDVRSLFRNENLSVDKTWNLVKASLDDYDNLPVNVFVEQIIADLASKHQHEEALETIKSWVKDSEYHKRHTIGSFDIVDNIARLVNDDSSFKVGVELLREYLRSDNFVEIEDTFDTYDVADVIAAVIGKDIDLGISILEEIYESENLTTNQQIVICASLGKIDENNKEALAKGYKFIQPKLEKLLDEDFNIDELDNIELIEKRFNFRHAREYFVEFAESLAKVKEYEKYLWLLKLFIHDSDPPEDGSNYPEDKDGTFNEHQKVANGEDVNVIRTVRGKVAWALQKFSLLPAQQYVEDAIPLLKKLAFDGNNYIRLQATYPLSSFAKNSHTVLPDNKAERFIPTKVADEIENIAFAMLNDSRNRELFAVMKGLVHVFGNMRYLDEIKANKLLNTFLDLPLPREDQEQTGIGRISHKGEVSLYEQVLGEIVPVFLYYAEYRKDRYNNEEWKQVFRDKWNKVKTFNETKSKELFQKLIALESPHIKSQVAWHLWQLTKSKGETYEKGFDVAYKYLEKLIKEYDYNHDLYKYVYYFIYENMDQKFEQCYNLWTTCLGKEKTVLERFSKNDVPLYEYNYWPFYQNGKILLKVLEETNQETFLRWLKYLTDYPEGVNVGNDLQEAVKKLDDFKDYKECAATIFRNLIEKRSTNYIDLKPSWLEN